MRSSQPRYERCVIVRYRDTHAHPPLLTWLREHEGSYRPKKPMPMDSYARTKAGSGIGAAPHREDGL